MQEIIDKAKKQMNELLDLVQDDLKGVKTGRAKPSLVENIGVEAYGSRMKLLELASISVTDSQTLTISPWDKTLLESVEKAINTSDLNLHANADGDLLRIKIPPLTEETRKDLVKLVYQKIESGRKLLRQVRIEIKKEIDGQKGKPNVSEDDIKKHLEELQKVVDEFSEKIEELGKVKEKELMTI